MRDVTVVCGNGAVCSVIRGSHLRISSEKVGVAKDSAREDTNSCSRGCLAEESLLFMMRPVPLLSGCWPGLPALPVCGGGGGFWRVVFSGAF
jgi:hypothetical protein